MNPLQLELTRLIGKKELTFGCLFDNGYGEIKEYGIVKLIPKIWEIIGHPSTLTDFHRWMNENIVGWEMRHGEIIYWIDEEGGGIINYDSSKELLEQSEETLNQIINLIKSNS